MSVPIRPMRGTEVFATRLDDLYPGLRLVDKLHPPMGPYWDPSYEMLAGIKGQPGVKKTLQEKRSI